jgi:salicylate hydroxylase
VAIIREIRQPLKWAMVKRKALSTWSIGNVTLLGDACHAILPFLGQGAAMAIEDGAVLARCFAEAGGNCGAAFERYQNLRVSRTSRIVEKSTDILPRFQNPLLTDEPPAKAYARISSPSSSATKVPSDCRTLETTPLISSTRRF